MSLSYEAWRRHHDWAMDRYCRLMAKIQETGLMLDEEEVILNELVKLMQYKHWLADLAF